MVNLEAVVLFTQRAEPVYVPHTLDTVNLRCILHFKYHVKETIMLDSTVVVTNKINLLLLKKSVQFPV